MFLTSLSSILWSYHGDKDESLCVLEIVMSNVHYFNEMYKL